MSLPVVCLLALCLLGAANAATPSIPQDCVDGVATGSNSLFPSTFYVEGLAATKSMMTFSQGFSVEYFNSYKLVTINATGETYCLYQCGTVAPSASTLPKGTKSFSIPVSSASVTDTTVVAFMAELGVLDRVRYVTKYSVAPCMQKLYLPKAANGCGLNAESPSGNATLDAANTLLKKQVAGVASVWSFFAPTSGSVEGVSISFPATADLGTLKRAEWIKYAALFFNKEAEANARFDAITTSYTATREAALKAAGTNKPLVAWASADFGMVSISLATYKAQYTMDAGGAPMTLAAIRSAGGAQVQCMNMTTYLPGPCAADSTTAMINISSSAGAAALRKVLKDVDVLIDETFLNSSTTSYADVTSAYAFTAQDTLPFLASKRVFRLDAHVKLPSDPKDVVTLEWFETAVARPDLALADFVAAITPSAAATPNTPAYCRNVATQKVVVVGPAQCKALSSCTVQPQPICPYVYKDCTTGELKYVTATNRCGPTCAATPTTPATPATTNATTPAPSNGVAALRPLLAVFFLIVALIESLIHLF